MDQVSNGRFQSLWRLVIILCTVLAVVTVLIVSFTKAPEGNAVPDGRTPVQAAATEAPAGTDFSAEPDSSD